MRTKVLGLVLLFAACKPTYGDLYDKREAELTSSLAAAQDAFNQVKAAPRAEAGAECDAPGLTNAFTGPPARPGNAELVDFMTLALMFDEPLYAQRMKAQGTTRACPGSVLDGGPLMLAARVGQKSYPRELRTFDGLDESLALAKGVNTLVIVRSNLAQVECAAALEVFLYDVASKKLRCGFLLEGTSEGVEEGYWVTISKRTQRVVSVTGDQTVARTRAADVQARLRFDVKERFGLDLKHRP